MTETEAMTDVRVAAAAEAYGAALKALVENGFAHDGPTAVHALYIVIDALRDSGLLSDAWRARSAACDALHLARIREAAELMRSDLPACDCGTCRLCAINALIAVILPEPNQVPA